MSETNETVPTTELTNAYFALAKSSLDNKIALTKQGIQENPDFAAKVQMPASLASTQTASAQIGLASAFIHSWIYTDPTLNFEDGSKLEFNGDAWGIGLGGGVIWMGGKMLLPAAQLVGDIDFAFTTNPTFTILNFFKNGNPAGSLAGGGINVQVGFFTGTGTFTAV